MSTNPSTPDQRAGHRDRLRARFLSSQKELSESELLELLLTYAIPRKDVAPIARSLITQFGSIRAILEAPIDELVAVEGIGASVAAFIKVIDETHQVSEVDQSKVMKKSREEKSTTNQLELFEADPAVPSSPAIVDEPEEKEKSMRVFANDEIQNALDFLPKAAEFADLDAFHRFLENHLPYNSEATRHRRANIILDRFFPSGQIAIPMTYYSSQVKSTEGIKALVFYHTLNAEPIAEKVAEELIWPALPVGRIDREQLREFTLRYLPDLSDSSQKNMLRSIFYAYQYCSVGLVIKETLRFNLRPGNFDSFLYLFTCEYPKPGIYSFESMYNGPLHRWLLWDREWLRRQLYNLRDLNIISKIAEIDAVRQFTVQVDQKTALSKYFTDPQSRERILREGSSQSESIDLNEFIGGVIDMRCTSPQIISYLRENLKLSVGRHLYAVLGSYSQLNHFVEVDLAQARFGDGADHPLVINLNLALLNRIEDSELRDLVQNEARLPQTVQMKLNREFDLVLMNLLKDYSLIVLQHLELLFAYNLDLQVVRARATNQNHILLLLPGEKRGEHITLFNEANSRFHRTLPPQLITENHLWEITNVE